MESIDNSVKARLRRWARNWADTGAALDAERVVRLQRLDESEARQHAQDLLMLWRPAERDEQGAELVAHQHWFMIAANRSRSR